MQVKSGSVCSNVSALDLLCREEEVVEERAVDKYGQRYMTIKELQAQEEQRRAGQPYAHLASHSQCLYGLLRMLCNSV